MQLITLTIAEIQYQARCCIWLKKKKKKKPFLISYNSFKENYNGFSFRRLNSVLLNTHGVKCRGLCRRAGS